MPAYAAAFSGEDHSIRAVVEMNIKQAEKLIAFMTEMEEKLSVLIQNVKEAEVDIFTRPCDEGLRALGLSMRGGYWKHIFVSLNDTGRC